jgi:hypothetical protein
LKIAVLGGVAGKKKPPRGKKNFANNFGLQISSQESPLKNEKNDTKIIHIGLIEAELWVFKVWGYPRPPKISTTLARPLVAQERKNLAHQPNSIGTTCTPKII